MKELIYQIPQRDTVQRQHFPSNYILNYLNTEALVKDNLIYPVEDNYDILFLDDTGKYTEFEKQASLLIMSKDEPLKIKLISHIQKLESDESLKETSFLYTIKNYRVTAAIQIAFAEHHGLTKASNLNIIIKDKEGNEIDFDNLTFSAEIIY